MMGEPTWDQGTINAQATAFLAQCRERKFCLTRCTAALGLAAEAHGGHVRALSGEAYVAHSMAVAHALALWSWPEDVVIAGLLHDGYEDAPDFVSVIAQQFGAVVDAHIVLVTKDAAIAKAARPKDLQMRLASALETGSPFALGAMAIKLADRLHNHLTAGGFRPEKRARFQSENSDFYVPMARLLGMTGIAAELHAAPQHDDARYLAMVRSFAAEAHPQAMARHRRADRTERRPPP